MRALYRVAYDLVLRKGIVQFNSTTLKRDYLEIILALNLDEILGQFHFVISPVMELLGDDEIEEHRVPQANKKTIRAIVGLNTLLGLGAGSKGSKLSERTFGHYIRTDSSLFILGFNRLPHSRKAIS